MMQTLRIWTGLVGAPFAWLVQVMLSEMLSSYACYPHRLPLAAPLWRRLPLGIVALDAGCLAIGVTAGLIAWQGWLATSRRLPRGEHAIESGETRDAFLVMLSALSSGIFIVAILFTSFAILLVSPCSAWSR